jgi:hypothetical protein
MKQVFAGTFMAAAFAVGLAAQAPAPQSQPPTPQSQPPMQEAKDAGKNVTVTGCLKAGDSADSFTLSDLKWKDDKAVGTSGSAAPAISATSLKVIGGPSAKLSDHVGHTVEVTGSIDKGDKDKAAAGAPASSSTPSLNARNVKMVAATCQAQ